MNQPSENPPAADNQQEILTFSSGWEKVKEQLAESNRRIGPLLKEIDETGKREKMPIEQFMGYSLKRVWEEFYKPVVDAINDLDRSSSETTRDASK